MSWRAWMRTYSSEDSLRFDALRVSFISEMKDGDGFRNVLDLVQKMCVARLQAIWSEKGWELDNPRRQLERRLGLPSECIEAMPLDLSISGKSYPAFPSGSKDYPNVADIAAPFIDSFSPTKARKSRGFFATPPDAVAEMLARLKLGSIGDRPRLFDPGCGSGMLSLEAMNILVSKMKDAASFEMAGDIFSRWRLIEKEPRLAAIASLQLLAMLSGLDRTCGGWKNWPVKVGDALDPTRDRFTHSIANPPFLGEKQARTQIADAIGKHSELERVYRGKADYWYLFLLRTLLQFEPGGRLVWLVPAYWPSADGASLLRQTLAKLADLRCFIELERPVPGASGLQPAIVSFVRHKNGSENDKTIEVRRNGLAYELEPSTVVRGSDCWRIMERPFEIGWLDTMERNGVLLGKAGGPFEVHCGIQSGADRVTTSMSRSQGMDTGRGIFVLSDMERKDLLRRCSEREAALMVPLTKTPACGPWLLDTRAGNWLLLLDGCSDISDLPAIEKHLSPYRDLLEKRRECRSGKIPWWRLHWPRNPELFRTPSILAPQRAAYPRFALAMKGAYSSVDVYHLKPRKGLEAELFGWLAVLHSRPVKLWLSRRGKRKGMLFELYGTPLSCLPLPAHLPEGLTERGRKIHAMMTDVEKAGDRAIPWHRRWLNLGGNGKKEIVAIESLLDGIDSTVGHAYGLNDSTISAIRDVHQIED